ncbi:MAG: DUF4321 domain-containing protein [Eubacteriales bacterium]|jgi:hypothetical protein|nr:DUF4321 domain-containing protein [Eubacteriales bacterium]
MRKRNRLLVLTLLLVFGAAVGGFLSELAKDSQYFGWLSLSKQFGISNQSPVFVDLGIVSLTFGMMFNVSVSSIIGIIIAALVYRKL